MSARLQCRADTRLDPAIGLQADDHGFATGTLAHLPGHRVQVFNGPRLVAASELLIVPVKSAGEESTSLLPILRRVKRHLRRNPDSISQAFNSTNWASGRWRKIAAPNREIPC
jgi:hypothetical protein